MSPLNISEAMSPLNIIRSHISSEHYQKPYLLWTLSETMSTLNTIRSHVSSEHYQKPCLLWILLEAMYPLNTIRSHVSNKCQSDPNASFLMSLCLIGPIHMRHIWFSWFHEGWHSHPYVTKQPKYESESHTNITFHVPEAMSPLNTKPISPLNIIRSHVSYEHY